jgi:hypothetical protein
MLQGRSVTSIEERAETGPPLPPLVARTDRQQHGRIRVFALARSVSTVGAPLVHCADRICKNTQLVENAVWRDAFRAGARWRPKRDCIGAALLDAAPVDDSCRQCIICRPKRTPPAYAC